MWLWDREIGRSGQVEEFGMAVGGGEEATRKR